MSASWAAALDRARVASEQGRSRGGPGPRGGAGSSNVHANDAVTLARASDRADELRRKVTKLHTGMKRSPLRIQLRRVDAKLGVAVLRARQLALLPPLGEELPPLPRLLLELKAIRREHGQALTDSGLADALDRVIRSAGGGR